MLSVMLIVESQEGLKLLSLSFADFIELKATVESQEGLKLYVKGDLEPFAQRKPRVSRRVEITSQRARIYAGLPGGGISVGTVNGVRRR
jgi:hypothetical protein